MLRGSNNPRTGRANFGGKHMPDKPKTPMNGELDGSMHLISTIALFLNVI